MSARDRRAPPRSPAPGNWDSIAADMNRTDTPSPAFAGVHEWFEHQVKRSPAALAVRQGERTLTYEGLNRRANQLAHHLADLGVGEGVAAGVCLPLSIDLVVALLGILKTGGCYVPIDPGYPNARQRFMLENSGARVVVSTNELAEALSAGGCLVVRADEPSIADCRAEDPPPCATAGSPVYIIHTSGSTGQPKGAVCFHRGFLNLVDWYVTEFKLGPGDKALVISSPSFDLTQKNFFAPLVVGASLHLPTQAIFDPAEIVQEVARSRITWVNCTPSTFYPLAEEAAAANHASLRSLRWVFLGGESIALPRLMPWLSAPETGAKVVNTYGPTECTDVVSYYVVENPVADAERAVPIGRPIFNTQLYILDEEGQPLGVGGVGELHIGGVCVGGGYLNEEELVRDRFRALTFEGPVGPTIYATGDMCRYRADGEIEFLGRVDNQVKIRGFRVELGEVETALRRHPDVREAVVQPFGQESREVMLAAYVLAEPGRQPDAATLRAFLTEELPPHMIPSAFVVLDGFPLTPSGKVDRKRLPAPRTERPDIRQQYVSPRDPLERFIADESGRVLGLDRVGVHDPFFELGGTSLGAVDLTARIGRFFGTSLPVVWLFETPTVAGLAETLRRHLPEQVREKLGEAAGAAPRDAARPRRPARRAREGRPIEVSGRSFPPDAVAIIGLAGRFPGAMGIDDLWRNLRDGVDGAVRFTREHLFAAGVSAETLDDPDYVPVGYPIDEAYGFDAGFFGLTPREAELMDPQQRLFLESCWLAVEHAGYDPQRCPGRVGVFGGIGRNAYLYQNILTHPHLFNESIEHFIQIGNERDFPTTHVSYRLGLTGPSVNVQTGCSTSGVAVHFACQSLRQGECTMALAGGVKVLVPNDVGYTWVDGSPLSPDGRIRAFDRRAAGMVRGSGAAFVVLKRLADAIRDGDSVHAVILGSAVNNDGAQRVGYSAPGVHGQAEVIAQALANAAVTADAISYVETHGTGTMIGDPIEVAGLTRAFRETSDATGFCALGSVKTNIGHLDAAATAAGLIKTVLAMRHRQLPPSLHFTEPNPEIDFDGSPFRVNDALVPWDPPNGAPRRAGVSSFGLGGSNAHLVLEEAPELPPSGASRCRELLLLSARSPAALARAAERLAAYLEENAQVPLADIAYTLQTGRRRFGCRRFVVAATHEEAARILREDSGAAGAAGTAAGGELAEAGEVVFMFPGNGSPYEGMGRHLFDEEPVFRAAVEQCAEIVAAEAGFDVRRAIQPSGDGDAPPGRWLQDPSRAMPALFTVEYAVARTLMSWGIRPAAMIGHSMGEYVAACLAGVVSLKDGLALVACRGRLFARLPAGSMLSVPLPADEARRFLSVDLSIAAVNRPDVCVVSGPTAAIEALQRRLELADIESTLVHIAVAAHSAMVDEILPEFRSFVSSVELRSPTIPYVSGMTGTWITAEQATAPDYWVDHLRRTVRFSDGLETLLAGRERAFVEVGPGQTLAPFARLHPSNCSDRPVVSTLRHPRDTTHDLEFLLGSLGKLWEAGIDIDWQRFHAHERRRRVPLPTYPFERKQHFLPPAAPAEAAIPVPGATASAAPTVSTSAGPPATEPEPVRSPPPKSPTEVSMSTTMATLDRKSRIMASVKDLIQDLSGLPAERIQENATFLELGFDSLFLARVNGALKKRLKARITVRQLLESTPTVAALVSYLDESLPSEAFMEPVAAGQVSPAAGHPAGLADAAPPPGSTAAVDAADAGAARPIDPLAAQLQALAAQVGALQEAMARGTLPAPNNELQAPAPAVPVAPPASQSTAPAVPVAPPASQSTAPAVPVAPPASQSTTPAVPLAPPASQSTAPAPSAGGERMGPAPGSPVDKREFGMNDRQHENLERLIEKVNARTPGSKRKVAQHRKALADPRSLMGFRRPWKELVYPVVFERSEGSRIWDIDGNEYIDVVGGFGVYLLGHSPACVMEAMQAQLRKGIAIGPQTALAGEVAELICEMTGVDRVSFGNTGSEAVVAAIRIARTVTGRDRIATFSGHYHGMFDEVLARRVDGPRGQSSIPIAAGIPQKAVDDLLILDYGDRGSFDRLRQHADDIALILLEPVRSRNPDLQPRDFLHELRAVADEIDVPILFDEMITGFRSAPGGAQELFGVRADLVTYGKVIAGGMPIGVVAGKAEYMDALDGGHWDYGDDSVPEADVTWFAGTFVRHPLALAAAQGALSHLKESGPQLQQGLNARTTEFVDDLNDHFRLLGAPIWVEHFSSMFMPRFDANQEFSTLLTHQLALRGVYSREDRPLFFTTAHTEQDLERVAAAFKDSVEELQRDGFLETAAAPARLRPDEAPLTEQQREIWISTRFGREASCAYNLSNTPRFRGPMDVDAMRAAIIRLVDRHAALRAAISPDGERQRFGRRADLDIALVDLSHLSPARREREYEQLCAHEVTTPFDLESGPLVRARIVRLGARDHVVALVAHHVCVDGWSLGVLARDLGRIYTSLTTGAPAELAPVLGFDEYAVLQASAGTEPERTSSLEYWKAEYATIPPSLDLPTDRPRPQVKTYAAHRAVAHLDRSFVGRLRDVAAAQKTTLFTLAFAAFEAFLARLTGQTDLVTGFDFAGQSVVEDRDLVGHCVSFLPLRLQVDPGAPFTELLATARGKLLDAMEHSATTYATIVENLELPRDPSRLPLVSVAFNLDPSSLGYACGDLEVTPDSIPRRFENMDLFMNLVELEDGIEIQCTYNTDLFDEGTIDSWLNRFRGVLSQVCERPRTPVCDLRILTSADQRFLDERNATGAAAAPRHSVPELFEAQALRTPHAVAVEDDDNKLTYRELRERSRHLGRYLRSRGIAPGHHVGVMLGRSTEMVCALLAVMRIGAVYVPLDPAFPARRLRFMIDDADVAVVVTEPSFTPLLQQSSAMSIVLDSGWARADLNGDSDLPPPPGLEQPVYVNYTSGSTGQPKGVVVTHGNLANLLGSMRGTPGFTPDDIMLALTTLSFDIAGLELYLPLTVGGRVIVAGARIAEDSGALAATIERSGATIVQATPSQWQLLFEGGWPGRPGLKALCGGEALSRDLADRLLNACGEVWNMYGPTETTIWSSCWKVEPAGPISLGSAIDNTRLYVLDDHLQPLPPGSPGELFIAGAGVAKEYWKRPELTAERFLADPFSSGEGERMYRTGDLVRLRATGRLEFLSRVDHQVKVRGHRIELAEIEAALCAHEDVAQAVVSTHVFGAADVRLLAYVVPRDGTRVDDASLRSALRATLPLYMIPQHFIGLPRLPLGANGKVDRNALPLPDDELPDARRPSTPASETEQRVASIWSEVLDRKEVDTRANFFDLGGHSILATRLLARINRDFGVDLPFVRLFTEPTVADISRNIEAMMRTDRTDGREETEF